MRSTWFSAAPLAGWCSSLLSRTASGAGTCKVELLHELKLVRVLYLHAVCFFGRPCTCNTCSCIVPNHRLSAYSSASFAVINSCPASKPHSQRRSAMHRHVASMRTPRAIAPSALTPFASQGHRDSGGPGQGGDSDSGGDGRGRSLVKRSLQASGGAGRD